MELDNFLAFWLRFPNRFVFNISVISAHPISLTLKSRVEEEEFIDQLKVHLSQYTKYFDVT